jgi:hypothetical protein
MKNSATFLLYLLLTSAWSISGSAQGSQSHTQVTGLPFLEVMKKIEGHSPTLSAATASIEVSSIQLERAKRHWLPRVFVNARSFQTNDPALSFMSVLNQREIASPDFSPDSLNHPSSKFYHHISLGVDLPLYEGGSRQVKVTASEKLLESEKLSQVASSIELFAEAGQLYAALITLIHEQIELENLSSVIGTVINRYQIGSRTNPVGYSGLLGLKSLRNKIDGLIEQNRAKNQATRSSLSVLADNLPSDWVPESNLSILGFLDNYFPNLNTALNASKTDPTRIPSEGKGSAAIQSLRLKADAADAAVAGHSVRFLPRIGLFGESALTRGDRATGSSATAGLYLQWSLFDPENSSVSQEARLTANIYKRQTEAMTERENISNAIANAKGVAAEKNLALLNSSSQLLTEQTEITRGLFQNGSINALQFIEVLSRRLDLINAQSETESALIDARIQGFKDSRPVPPQ